jgi:periplasmic mercuric ion binding protein
MKALIIFLSFSMSTLLGISQIMTTTEFKVYGNCGMCEKRIEKAVAIDGVEKADWNKESKIMSITFNPSKVELDQIHQKIADSGHDTDEAFAKVEVYDKLPGCCKYDRPEKPNDNDHKDRHNQGEGDHHSPKY